MKRLLIVISMLLALHVSPTEAADTEASSPSPDEAKFEARLRRPTSLALSADEKFLYAANRCGSISVIDLDRQSTITEFDVGQRLSDIKVLPDNRTVVTDEAAHELILLQSKGADLSVLSRTSVSPYPVSVSFDRQRGFAYVASLWTRRISRIEVQGDQLKQTNHMDLEIAPRAQAIGLDHQHLFVADSFDGRIAVIQLESFELAGVRQFPGHNIRGLACTPESQMLVVAHQMLNHLAHSDRNDVHWGLLMSNDLRWLRLANLLSAESNLYAGAHMHPLGQAGSATADPSGVAIAPNGTAIVTLGGVNQVALGKEQDFSFYRVTVGERPTAVVTTSDSHWAYVANTFGDSITRVDLAARKASGEISLGPQTELSLVDRGEQLFYDASLSHDGWMSCHSCHTDGHSNNGLNDNSSDGSFGAAKRVLSLLGVHETLPLAWNGLMPDLKTQLLNSTEHTMQKDNSLQPSQAEALIAYIESLGPPPSVDRLRGTINEEMVTRGEKIFHRENCVNCHAPPLYTTAGRYDVGLDDKSGNREFNPPSLRGVSQRSPYFHDNRAAKLEDVLGTMQHQLETPLSDTDLADLVAFLRSL